MTVPSYDAKITRTIKWIRLFKRLTQDNCAKFLNVTQATYSRIENGETAVSITALKKLSQAYNIDICDVIRIAEIAKSQEEVTNLLFKMGHRW